MKKVTNKSYEEDNISVEELPGGENVRLTYSRGLSLNYGEFKVDYAYSADFPKEEVGKAYERIEKYIDNRLKKKLADRNK